MAVLWGGNNIAIKFSLTGIPPFALAGIRFLVGSVIVLVWVYMDRVSLKMKSGEKGSLVLLAFLFTVQISLLNVGIHHTLAGRSTILISTHPFFIGIFARIDTDSYARSFPIKQHYQVYLDVLINFNEFCIHSLN